MLSFIFYLLFVGYTPTINQSMPIKDYAPGLPEKETLLTNLNEMSTEIIDIPLIIGADLPLMWCNQNKVLLEKYTKKRAKDKNETNH